MEIPADTNQRRPKFAAGILQRARKRPVVTIAALLGCFLLALLNYICPLLRFRASIANDVAILLVFFLPWLGLRYVFALRKWWQTAVAFVLLVPVLLLSLLGGILAAIEVGYVISTGADFWSTVQHSTKIEMGAYRVVAEEFVYGGAAGGEAVEVRQERTLIPGVLLVRRLETVEDAEIASCRVVGPDELRVELRLSGMKPGSQGGPYQQIGSKDNEYHLKRFLYF